jgi:putative transposase
VRRLTERKIRWILRQIERGIKIQEIAAVMKVSPRRIYQIHQYYRTTGTIPALRPSGRRKRLIDENMERIILTSYARYRIGPVLLEKVIERDHDLHIPHNTIYQILLRNNLIEENMRKRRQRKWVRFERDHAMSLWQGDWKRVTVNGKDRWLIAFMDDASRFIACYGVFDSPTAENTLQVLEGGIQEYGAPREILTDHGTQFVAARNRENAVHTFKEYLTGRNIRHIVARINHPQTNGKIERWYGLVKQKLHLFESLREFVTWYNDIKPHMSLNLDELETPSQAFWRKMPPERILGFSWRWMNEE